MRSVYNFVITPKGERYNNIKKIGNNLDIKPGDSVIVHHNVFRRWNDIKGEEKNSRSYFNEKTYLIYFDQIFLYKRNNQWKAPKGYCFVQPLKNTDKFNTDLEKPLMGVVKYSDGTVKEGDLIGFNPGSEYEFVIEGVRMYRVLSNLITIKYEYQGNEETYNPSWAQSG